MILWEKESSSADACYVDLFFDKTQIPNLKEWTEQLQFSNWKKDFFYSKIDPGKNTKTSDFLRSIGNAKFRDGEWIHTMEFYSESLCFAELGTNNVSFAYANRAACFLNMKRYDECLRDIELAEQANYPNMSKLMQRKANCQRSMQGTNERKLEMKLSFNANAKFPCLIDGLEIRMNSEYGRHVIAGRDIDVGQTVLVEKCYVSLGCAPDRVQCYTCTKDEANFVACPKCADVMFCSENCLSQNYIHQKFCGASMNRMPSVVRFVAESFLVSVVEFSTASEMIGFVQETLAARGKLVPDTMNDSRSKYGQFLNLRPKKQKDIDMEVVYKVFTGLLDIPSIAEHFAIVKNNSIATQVPGGIVKNKLGIVMSWFNHSCAPNLFNCAIDDTEIFITKRPIKKGDQLFIRYLTSSPPTAVRRMTLLDKFHFFCKCDKCEPCCRFDDRTMMKNDRNFQFLASVPKEQFTLPCVSDKCLEFLQKFGHLPWSEEIDLVLNIYSCYLFDIVPKSF